MRFKRAERAEPIVADPNLTPSRRRAVRRRALDELAGDTFDPSDGDALLLAGTRLACVAAGFTDDEVDAVVDGATTAAALVMLTVQPDDRR